MGCGDIKVVCCVAEEPNKLGALAGVGAGVGAGAFACEAAATSALVG